ncbi:Shikimate 5-dehydrogenase [Pseudomonas amygdali pv. lachrymans]|nr:Shikimate 5-dehydrogenase [Pseudomonas amygdali pv. lachrymans]
MPITANRDTLLCMSMAARPGNFGVRFHNHLYQQLGLNFYYKTFSPNDLAAAVAGIRSLGIRGSAVSMPFKEACIELVDELDASAAAIQSINTIVNTDGHLKAFNTDYIAVAQLMESHAVPRSAFALRGSGGMAKAVAFALRDAGFTDGLIVARNEQAGRVDAWPRRVAFAGRRSWEARDHLCWSTSRRWACKVPKLTSCRLTCRPSMRPRRFSMWWLPLPKRR